MRCLVGVLVLATTTLSSLAEESWFKEPAAPGESIGLATADLQAVESFKASDPIIGTYLFYWYDVYSQAPRDRRRWHRCVHYTSDLLGRLQLQVRALVAGAAHRHPISRYGFRRSRVLGIPQRL